MDFRIKHIKIENFRSIELIDTDVWDETVIEGDNETAKTTTASAILWCLTGKDMEGNSTFEIVPIGKYGVVSPSVLMECVIGNRPVELKRQYKAKFTRDKKFSDYAVTTYVNGIETGVRAFQDWVSENICNEQVFKILSNPKTFIENCPKETKELMWQAQRRFLMSMIADIESESEAANNDNRWEMLREPLQRYDNASQYLTFLKNKLNDFRSEIEAYPIRINEKASCKTNYGLDSREISKEIESVSSEIERLNKEKEEARQREFANRAELIKEQIQRLTDEKIQFEKDYMGSISLFNTEKAERTMKCESVKKKLEDAMKTLQEYISVLESLKTTEIPDRCKTCGAKLNPKSIETAAETIRRRISVGEEKISNLKDQIAELKKEYDFENSNLRSLMEPTYPCRVEEIQEEISKLTKSLCEIQTFDGGGYEEKIKEFTMKLNSLREKYALAKRDEEIEEQVQKMEKEQNEALKEFSNCQMLLDLTRDFISFRCKQAEEKINEMFSDVKFQLFEQNKSNDEVRETCIMRYRGVKYSDLSYSTKILAAVDVVKAFQKFYNITAPIFFDNAESITGTLDTGAQTFFMRVRQELCPECSGQSGRRNADGTWTCRKCGHVWKKELSIVEV